MIVLIFYLVFISFSCSIITYLNYIQKKVPGPKGLKGPPGEKGDKGFDGYKGEIGRMGRRGYRGPRGSNNGVQGLTGDMGYIGEKGPIGLKGYRGFKGRKGDKGEIGIKGTKGRDGNPGPRGKEGDAGEYIYTEIDYDSCEIIPFDTDTREVKCPKNYFLTGINNVTDKHDARCCKLKLDESCRNMPLARQLFDYKKEMVGTEFEYKYLTEEEESRRDKYRDFYGNYVKLHYLDNYKCDKGGIPVIKGDSAKVRCCKKEDEELIESEELDDLNFEELKY